MINMLKSKKFLLFLSLILVQAMLLSVMLSSCGFLNISSSKHYKELNAAYSYDFETQVLKKFASEVVIDEKNELMSFDGKSAKPIKYTTVKIKLPRWDYTLNSIIDVEVPITYAVYNDKLIIAEAPEIEIPYESFPLNGSTDSVIISVKDIGTYLINLSDISAEPLYPYIVNGVTDLNWKIISLSSDNRYFLFEYGGLDLWVYDMNTRTELNLKDYNYVSSEFLCWEKDSSDTFLYRSKSKALDGTDVYSPIYKYSISTQSSEMFMETAGQYAAYEMIDDELIYAYAYKSSDMNGILYIKNIYTQEETAVLLPRYAHVWNIALSESKTYAALCALYIDASGHQVSRLLTVNLETNDIRFYYELGYEVGMENYNIYDFYWCPNNNLIINFINNVDLYRDLCRFHKINHTKSNIPKVDIEGIIQSDIESYEE